jgi:hypothetical protein
MVLDELKIKGEWKHSPFFDFILKLLYNNNIKE